MLPIKTNTELLTKFCYFLAGGSTLALTKACKIFSEENETRITWPSVYMWMRDPSIILPEFMGETDVTLKKAVTMARKCAAIASVTQSLEDKVANGVVSKVWANGGEPSWEDDEAAIRATPDELATGIELGYFWADKKRRDADGNRVQRTRTDPAPAQLVEMYARSQLRHVYGDKSEINVKGNMNLGVQVLGRSPGRPFKALPAVQVVAPMITETTLEVPAIEYNDAEKVPVESFVAEAPLSANEAALMLRATQGRTQMERDLSQRALDAMRKAREAKS